MRTTTHSSKPDSAKRAPGGSSARSRGPLGLPSWLSRDLILLLGGRGLRSLAQAYLVIIVPLYLAGLGFSAEQLGVVFTAAAISSALLTAGVGILSDRFGRKTFLILISLLMAAGGFVFALSGNFLVLVVAGALGTIGRGGGAGSGGAWGPFFPAEQALLAEHAGDLRRTSIFGLVSFVGVMAGAVGSLLAALPVLLHQQASLSVIDGDRVLFLLTTALGVAMAVMFLPIRELAPAHLATLSEVPSARTTPAPSENGTDRGNSLATQQAQASLPTPEGRRVLGLSRGSWGLVARFMVTNATNGLAVGIIGPFMVYWFFRRYGVGSDTLAGLFFVINLVAALPYLLAGRLARRLGAVRLVVLTRSVSVILLAVLAVMPTFALAGGLYLLRTAFNTLSNPVRQSYLMGIIPARERSSAAGLSNLPSQVGMSISPSIAGYLIQQVALDLPLEIAALLQGINAALYFMFFRHIHPPEEAASSRSKANSITPEVTPDVTPEVTPEVATDVARTS